jgi:phosphoadenosine phosphosulfate reductase
MDTNLQEKERTAIERLKAFEPDDGYFLAYSGGKDSDCIKILADLAGVKYEAVHNLTTVGAPETVQYVKSQPDIKISRSYDKDGKPITMWNLIVRKGTPPLRISRYCCSELKEPGGAGKIVVTGVRWAESSRRKESADVVKFLGKPKATQRLADELGAEYRVTKQGGIILNDDNDANRRMVEHCYRTRKTMVNPIVDWTDDDVWAFLSHYGCKSNPLYECGFKRIGCIGCPMARKHQREEEFARYPTYKKAYIRAFDKMLERRIAEGKPTTIWTDGQSVFDWWING